jgi:regulator of RNase E activity RraA
MSGNAYLDRTDWWGAIEELPVPRIAVIQDIEAGSGLGSAMGEVHAAILKALRCDGVITNGTVRDIPGVARMQFQAFASAVAVSHSYMHVVDYGAPVEIFGLKIHSGSLVYADCHGVISIPLEIAGELPKVASQLHARERRIIDVCQSPAFSPEKLLQAIKSPQ